MKAHLLLMGCLLGMGYFFTANAAPTYTFSSGYVPTISMSSRTLNGANVFGFHVKGFSELPEYRTQYNQMMEGVNSNTLNLKMNDSLADKQIQFQYKDENGVLKTVDTAQGGDVKAAGDAYREFLKGGESNDQNLVGKDIVVGTEQIYVDPVTHEGQMYIPKPSKPIKPPTISLEKQQELAQDEANGIPIKAVGNEITFTHPATVNLGVEVGPGTYQVGKCQKNQPPGTGYVQPDASGNFTSCAEPKAPGSDSGFGNGDGNSGAGNGGGGSGAGGGLGGLGGLGQMLPLLLASMLGGGLGGGQGNQGTGNGNGLTNTQTSCSQYGVSPVCGSDGKTYNNSCWLQQLGQVQVSTGVCPTTSTSPSPTPDVGKIVAQLVAAGVPQSVIDDIIKSLNYTIPHTSTDSVVVQ